MSGKKLKKNASHPDATESHYVPYTADELAESRGQRKFLNAVNVLNARLWMCVHFAECACEAIKTGDHHRAYSYFRALDIGNEYVSVSIASAIQRIREQIISKGEGNAPVAGSVNGLVKVLATYIQLRLEIHATDSIIRADRAGRAIADMLTSHEITCGDGEKFATYVNTTFATLISALEDHYEKTALILSSRIENCRPEPKSVEKPLKVEVIGKSRSKPRKSPAVQEDSAALRKCDDNSRVIHEINKRHRDGAGSYPKIIRSMMSDPVWSARMKSCSAGTWKTYALDHKRK